jgi:hypothetical protein
MTAIISWNIASLERETSDGFVFTAHWTVNAVEGEYSASAYGSVGLERPDELIPYEDLTEETVVSWVQESMGEEQVESIEDNLLAQIAEQKAPQKAQGLPWS